ncbi:unnamed protein product [Mytilus edulis]|uniref:Uncharacterized protein n=1 Tax=Mytilus edulis TaxID=6550 RepID=A0A8S3VQJ9_MYTED|nr:unnamed protein product [Mytilus edulis]
MLLLNVLAVNAEKEKLVQRTNYGVTFVKEADIVFGSEHWFHTFEISIPHKIHKFSYPSCDIIHQNCFILNQVISHLSALKTDVASNVNSTVEIIHKLIPKADFKMNTTSTQSRSKRGLFNFIGSISRSLFGTATVKDVQKLARHVNILINRNNKFAKAMTEHDQLLSSFMSKTDERFQNIVLGVQQNHDIMVNLTSETSKFVAHFEEVSVKLSNLLIDQMNLSSSVNKYLEELKIGIHEMVKGNLSPFLISPNILKNTLKHVQLILNEKFKGFYLLNTDPAYYYSSSQLLYARNHSTLYVTLKFPISTFSSPLALYRVNSFPVPINSSSNHGTKIMDLPEYFVVTSNNQYYNHISYSRISSCTGKTTLFCSYSLPLVSTVSQSCISSLYFNSKQDVNEHCDFRFLMNVIKATVEEIYDNTLLVYKMNTLAFECPNKHKIVKGSIRRTKIYDRFSEMQIKMENGNGDFKEEYKLRNDYNHPGRANFMKKPADVKGNKKNGTKETLKKNSDMKISNKCFAFIIVILSCIVLTNYI